ncbi:hypothetical protein CesoFtcFv8_007956 [Champsocephalus esox]|uniref:Uncharacterized protein n=1 Tax=Champsocephalus esox TaxID=159716 RepID=A0AAN8CF79_9TELE|nr:hypothetical protein CesoFtcFv8_007956 [Champsocephalus esox]
MYKLTGWAVVGSVLSELSQTVKVMLTVVTGEDVLVIEVIVAVIVLVMFSILSARPMTFFEICLSVGRWDFWGNTHNVVSMGSEAYACWLFVTSSDPIDIITVLYIYYDFVSYHLRFHFGSLYPLYVNNDM